MQSVVSERLGCTSTTTPMPTLIRPVSTSRYQNFSPDGRLSIPAVSSASGTYISVMSPPPGLGLDPSATNGLSPVSRASRVEPDAHPRHGVARVSVRELTG